MIPVNMRRTTFDRKGGMRVLLATDSPDLGHALRLFLSERRISVVDVVGDGELVVRQAAAARPDVVVLDWRLGDAASCKMVADLMGGDDPTPVIVLSTTRDRPRAKRSGAAAYATLGDPPDALLATIHEVGLGPAERESV
jgi:DNA-binding response OmpR family regulator